MKKYTEVFVSQDDCGHWYVVPKELETQWSSDIWNDTMADSGEFDEKYGRFRTGGDINLVQLFKEVEE